MKIVVAMSGGVDSSVAAALLKEQGHEVIGVHLHFWTDPNVEALAPNIAQNKCCTLGGLEDARYVAGQLWIPFYVMNVEKDFKENVVDYFLESHAHGQTPNPCVACNRTIKFGELLKRAKELGADSVASGHYARVHDDPATGKRSLFMGKDKEKDQSYFLYHLGQEKLKHVMFPIGEFESKAKIYEHAQRLGLIRVCEKPQSQGLCFFSEASPKFFLQRYLDAKHFVRGPIKTVDGRTIGEHRGLPLYTIGQRSGLGIGGIKGEPEGEPWYVVRLEPTENALIVGRERDILEYRIICEPGEFVAGTPPEEARGEGSEILLRIRHRGELVPARLTVATDNSIELECHAPVRGVSPGQAAVFYRGEEVLGGAIIKGTRHGPISKKI